MDQPNTAHGNAPRPRHNIDPIPLERAASNGSDGHGRASRSFRFNLWLLILSIAVPALVTAGFLGTLWAVNEQQSIGESAEDFARTLSENLDRQAASVMAMLATLAAAAGPGDDLLAFDDRTRRVTAMLLGLPAADQSALQIVLRNQDGVALRGVADEAAEDVASWRTALAPTIEGGVTHVTDLISTATGPVVGIAVPTDIEGGAALVLEVPVAMIAGALGEPPADWIVAIFDRQGVTLARSHEPERFVGERGRDDIITAMQAEDAGVMQNISRENVSLYNAFHRSQVTGWSAIVGVPRANLTAPFWSAAASVAAVALVLALLGSAVTAYFQRRLSRSIGLLAAAADRMGIDKDLQMPHLEIAELDQIAGAMAKTSAGLIEEREHQEQLLAEMALAEKAASRLAAIVESSEDAILGKDLNGTITNWNAGATALFGYTAEEMVGQPVTMLIPADRTGEEERILAEIRRGQRIEPYETVRRRKDGSLVDISLSASPIRNLAGEVVGVSSIGRDITARKKAEERQELLLREMNHRVKNLFTLAGSVVSLSASWASDPDGLAEDIRSRLAALSRAHSLTFAPGSHWHGSDSPVAMHSLIRTIVEPYNTGSGGSTRIEIRGADIPIGNALTAVALLLHEFTTNAAKYGSLSVPDGRVLIECSSEEETYVIMWEERGGPDIEAEAVLEGFGTRLATSTVVGQLGGEISREWLKRGLRIRLAIPKDRLCS